MKYTIIIPTYNHCNDLLKPAVDSIFKYTDMQEVELIISANGCTDNTKQYLDELRERFDSIGFSKNLITLWSDDPLGYPRANNVALPLATADHIVLLNNDIVLLQQSKNQWLEMLAKPFLDNPRCGISCLVKQWSAPAAAEFAVFFCVMISRAAFDAVGPLNETYGAGAGEDVEFSIEAVRAGFEICQVGEKVAGDNFWKGAFPLYHQGEGTYHDKLLFPDWDNIFYRNGITLSKKYNREYYKQELCNHFERSIFLKDEPVDPRESLRYRWAGFQITQGTVLEIGCSTGFGLQFLPDNIRYTGIDHGALAIEAAQEQQWQPHAEFICADINQFELGYYDTIIAFEVIEHLENGLAVVEKLKQHCGLLLITVPYQEPPGYWGQYHKLHGLDQSHFPGFEFAWINEAGLWCQQPDANSRFNIMVCRYHAG